LTLIINCPSKVQAGWKTFLFQLDIQESHKKEGFFGEESVGLADFYRLSGTLSFACQAFYAVFFSGGI
jgi:hypothetical protein